MKTFWALMAVVVCGSVQAQQFDHWDWVESDRNLDLGAQFLLSSKRIAVDDVILVQAAELFFAPQQDVDARVGMVAFDCTNSQSSADLQWHGVDRLGNDLAPVVVAGPPSNRFSQQRPFGLTAQSRSVLVSDKAWGQVCQQAAVVALPENILLDEALLLFRKQNKSWRKAHAVEPKVFWTLEKQYKHLPSAIGAHKQQVLQAKVAERAELSVER